MIYYADWSWNMFMFSLTLLYTFVITECLALEDKNKIFCIKEVTEK
jgi:hypothetical protein